MSLKIVRESDWEHRLREAIECKRGQSFCWGKNDCSLFAADLISAMTGVDLSGGVRDAYSDRRGAIQWLKAQGYRNLKEAVTDRLGALPVDRFSAQRGDLVLCHLPSRRSCLAVRESCYFAVAPAERGVQGVHQQYWHCGWRIG